MAGQNLFASRIIIHLSFWGVILLISLPVVFAVIVSTQSPVEVFSYPPKLTPSGHFENYVEVWNTIPLARMFFNSMLISVLVTVGKIIISLLAAFAFTFFEFRGKNLLFFLTLVTLMLPLPVRIVPLFELIADLGKTVSPHLGIDSYFALVVPFLASATGTFLFRQHFLTVPSELLDAAKIDGCGPMRFLFLILLPLSWNAIGAMVAGGDTRIVEVVVIGGGDEPCTPCGGCRQKLGEFAGPDTPVHICGPEGVRQTVTLGDLLPFGFGPANLEA